MIGRIVLELGPWNWMVLGIILLVLEIVLPGVFLVWIGIASLIVGAISIFAWESGFWTWQTQVLLFLVLSVASAFAGRRLAGPRKDDSDQPLLNRRGDQLIGRTATLAEPIRNGRGRIQLGDTLWRVSGPDLPAGTQVRVTAVAETELGLVVEPIP
jgi:membrane protein implicated in regulation of membrane protease activity